MASTEQEVARIGASATRRVIGVGALIGLGAVLVYMGVSTDGMSLGWKLALMAGGVLALTGSQMMWRATALQLILTETELRDSTGLVLARLDEIDKVDRGVFAMKPSNGFVIFLKAPAPKAWRIGLWWRLGRRIAIGGVTAGSQTRPFADMITMQLEARKAAK